MLVEHITFRGAASDHSFWFVSREPLQEGGFNELRFMRRGAGYDAGDRKTMAICDLRHLKSFNRESLRQHRLIFRKTEVGVDDGLRQIEFATRPDVLSQYIQMPS